MFIKKDLRKISDILHDAQTQQQLSSTTTTNGSPPLKSLHLAKRANEFEEGRVKCLCEPTTTSESSSEYENESYRSVLQQVESLSLYDCNLSDVTGLGSTFRNLHDLSLGRNPITELPSDFGELRHHLQRLWLDDCQLSGALPPCIVDFLHLTELRVSHNALTSLPENLYTLWDLSVLCVDHNQLTALPETLPAGLITLQVRENVLTRLPRLPNHLQLLQASSNQLTEIIAVRNNDENNENDFDAGPLLWEDLTHVYLNRNAFTHVPDLFVTHCPHLQRLNLSHNHIPIDQLSIKFQRRFGVPDATTGVCSRKRKDGDQEEGEGVSGVVWLRGNHPLIDTHNPDPLDSLTVHPNQYDDSEKYDPKLDDPVDNHDDDDVSMMQMDDTDDDEELLL